MTTAIEEITGQGLISENLFNLLVNRITQEHDVARDRAARIMDQALAFLGTCAKSSEPLAPSDTVDIGWHTFILYTHEYAKFCERIAGRFIHHVPNDDEGDDNDGTPLRVMMGRTTDAISAAGFAVDRELWFTGSGEYANCSQCKNGCTDDPPPMFSMN